MFSVLSFGTENSFVDNNTIENKVLSLDNNFATNYNIVIDEYDICTVTVTVQTSCGSYSATASNNQADCFAAREAAYDHAMMLAGAMCGIP